MQRDVLPEALDWVFCYRTELGAVHDRARWASMNGRPVPYQPHTHGPDQGVRYVVRGRVRSCPLPPVGPRLDQQGMFSRLSCWVAGYVTSGTVIPARDPAELETLCARASELVREGRVKEWALAELSADGLRQWGISLAAREALVAELAAHVDAPFRLRLDEGGVYTRTPTRLDCIGPRDAGVVAEHDVDALFDAAPPPAFVEDWRERGVLPRPSPAGPDNAIFVPFERPTGPNAWSRWVREEAPSELSPSERAAHRRLMRSGDYVTYAQCEVRGFITQCPRCAHFDSGGPRECLAGRSVERHFIVFDDEDLCASLRLRE
jgi:hypothetical protein